ncbi:bifunctional serine/threonine-protein kinase/formylglycine-generating enzyme family protein, partial [Myxococcota bacterium]|nr:bifunctional serine/threonine-protein kinase/formylglycine-generating enzyme family protein [Myxococcota bacterium]
VRPGRPPPLRMVGWGVARPTGYRLLAARFGCTLRPAQARDPLYPLPLGYTVQRTWGGGRFLDVGQVGKGGTASVHRAWDSEMGVWRALKVLHRELLAGVDDRHRRRFRREASIIARLPHPHIVRVFDIGVDEQDGVEIPWQVYEWVEGGDLDARAARGPVPLDEALALLLPVIDALELAWAQKVLHRDVKPANVLLDGTVARLCDFGLAALDDDGHTLTRQRAVRTPGFMAPEFDKGKVDHRADIYGWTATLACAISGQQAPGYLWDEDDLGELLDRLETATRTRVEPLVRAGCAKRPDRRPQDAAAIRALLAEPRPTRARAPVTPGPDALEARIRDLLRTPPWWAVAEDLAAVLSAPVEAVRARVQMGEPMLRLAPKSLRGLAEGAGARRVLTLPGGVELPLRWVPVGTFWMGSPEGVGYGDEHPRHPVTLSAGYWLGETPVTQAQWNAVNGGNPARVKGDDRPVESVTWQECVDFCRHFGKAVPDAAGIRLPTEAQWERACRAGTDSRWCHGDEEAGLERFAWYGKGAGGQTAPVRQCLPNPWGLHDTHGNVWEWCQDEGYHRYRGPVEDPEHADGGERRVVRGGSFWVGADWCRSAFRDRWLAVNLSEDLGLRLLLPGAPPSPTEPGP